MEDLTNKLFKKWFTDVKVSKDTLKPVDFNELLNNYENRDSSKFDVLFTGVVKDIKFGLQDYIRNLKKSNSTSGGRFRGGSPNSDIIKLVLLLFSVSMILYSIAMLAKINDENPQQINAFSRDINKSDALVLFSVLICCSFSVILVIFRTVIEIVDAPIFPEDTPDTSDIEAPSPPPTEAPSPPPPPTDAQLQPQSTEITRPYWQVAPLPDQLRLYELFINEAQKHLNEMNDIKEQVGQVRDDYQGELQRDIIDGLHQDYVKAEELFRTLMLASDTLKDFLKVRDTRRDIIRYLNMHVASASVRAPYSSDDESSSVVETSQRPFIEIRKIMYIYMSDIMDGISELSDESFAGGKKNRGMRYRNLKTKRRSRKHKRTRRNRRKTRK